MAPGLIAWYPKTEADRETVLEQLNRLLGSSAFRRSTRCPKLLGYIVKHALDNNPENLKEKSIGVEVFGRQPDYATSDDPIVRVTASEVRKRLAQYYHEAGHQHELRIDLLPYSYVPVFQWPQIETLPQLQTPPSVAPSESTTAAASNAARRRLQPVLTWSAFILLALIACLIWLPRWAPRSAAEVFWSPLLEPGPPVTVVVGTPEFGTILLKSGVSAASGAQAPDPHHVAFPDVYSVSVIVALLSSHKKPLAVEDSSKLSFTDLQSGPAVMVGGFNNPWTLRATRNLRFHFVLGPAKAFILDTNNPAAQTWFVDRALSASDRTEDYGIVARFMNPDTNQATIVAAGIGGGGTVAASELLADPKYASLLNRNATRDTRNIEMVVGTDLIEGKPGPPKILASAYW